MLSIDIQYKKGFCQILRIRFGTGLQDISSASVPFDLLRRLNAENNSSMIMLLNTFHFYTNLIEVYDAFMACNNFKTKY